MATQPLTCYEEKPLDHITSSYDGRHLLVVAEPLSVVASMQEFSRVALYLSQNSHTLLCIADHNLHDIDAQNIAAAVNGRMEENRILRHKAVMNAFRQIAIGLHHEHKSEESLNLMLEEMERGRGLRIAVAGRYCHDPTNGYHLDIHGLRIDLSNLESYSWMGRRNRELDSELQTALFPPSPHGRHY